MINNYFARRALVVAAAALTLVPLAACSTDPITPTPVADTTTTTSSSPSKTLSDDQTDMIFLRVVGEHGLHGQEAIDAAKSMCSALDRGATPEQVALIALRGFDGDTDKAGALLGAGSVAYCPEYTDSLANIGKGTGA